MIYDNPLISAAYAASPPWVQDGLVSLYGSIKRRERFTRAYAKAHSEIRASMSWTSKEATQLQRARLRQLIDHCYANVPYYRKMFDRIHLSPADIRSADDLALLPYLSKDIVRDHAAALRAVRVPTGGTTVGRTGGTTGLPLEFLLDRDRVTYEHAVLTAHWESAGYRPGDRVAIVRGHALFNAADPDDRPWRTDWVDRRLYVSSFHLNPAQLGRVLGHMRAWKPRFLAGYPSSLVLLAEWLLNRHEPLPVSAVFTSSETLTTRERDTIQRGFAAPVFDYYGSGERLVAARQCASGRYHVAPTFGIVEFDNTLTSDPSVYEIVATGLGNFSMPLLRYRIGDTVELAQDDCTCGRPFGHIVAIHGRKDDAIRTPDGRVMPRAGLDQVPEFTTTVQECQLVQTNLHSIEVRVVPHGHLSDADARTLRQRLRDRVGRDIDISITVVERLELTSSGKRRFIISHVPANLTEAPAR